MTEFQGDLINTVLGGFVFAVIVAIVGFIIDRKLKSAEAKLDRKLQIAKDSLPAMQRLWKLMEPIKFDNANEVTGVDLIKLRNSITHWYYSNGDGIFLSAREQIYLRYARSMLTEADPDEEKLKSIRDTFSMLRTIIKWKLDIYDDAAGSPEIELKIERELVNAGAWAASAAKQGIT